MMQNHKLLSRVVIVHHNGSSHLVVDVKPRGRLVKIVAELHVNTIHPSIASVPKVDRSRLKALSLLWFIHVLHDTVKKLLTAFPVFSFQVRSGNRVNVQTAMDDIPGQYGNP